MKIPKISIDLNFDWLKKAKLVELKDIDINSDPVRPDLPVSWRINHGRKMFGLYYGKDLMAVMCFAYTNEVPKTLYELDKLSEVAHLESVHRVGQQGKIAVAYTVWSLKKGGGRMIVNEVHKMIKDRLRIPMKQNMRSLNVASSVAIILAECLRQIKLT